MKKLQWSTIQKKVDDLTPQEINPRTISKKQMQDLTTSLEKYNLVEIPAIDKDGTILAGHQRIKALQVLKRGKEMIDVRIPNRKLTEEEAKQYLISSNAISGDWDYDLLKDFEFDLLISSGMEPGELAKGWDQNAEVKNTSKSKPINSNKKAKTKLGDVIHLGDHRIICGDSTKQETLTKLFEGSSKKASMIYSDPVYNIDIDYSGGVGGKKDYGGTVNDTRTEDEYFLFIRDSLQAGLSVSKKDTHVFYWCDQIYIGLIQTVYKNLGVANKRVALWLKNNQNPVPSIIMNKVYEPCVYGIKGSPYLNPEMTVLNEVMNKEMGTGNNLIKEVDQFITDIWTAKRISGKEYEHATSKPLDLHEKVIKRCTKPGEIILDSFLGSGSTLLAADQLSRIVYGCELEPLYCDLIIKRYEEMTGKKAIVKHHGQAG